MNLYEVALYRASIVRAGHGTYRDPHRLDVFVLAETAGQAEEGAKAMNPGWSVLISGIARPNALRLIFQHEGTWMEA